MNIFIEKNYNLFDKMDANIIFVPEDPNVIKRFVSDDIFIHDFKGKLNEVIIIYGKDPARTLLVGVGKDNINQHTIGAASRVAFNLLKSMELEKIWIKFSYITSTYSPFATFVKDEDKFSLESAIEEVVLSFVNNTYTFDFLKKKSNDVEYNPELYFLNNVSFNISYWDAIRKASAIGKAKCMVKDLVNTPSNLMTPYNMLQASERIVVEHNFGLEVMDEDDAEEMGMLGFYNVSYGSSKLPYIVVLDNKPKSDEQPIVLIGKGVTFDSGGISLKPASGMEDMKTDMAGAATVLGIFDVLGNLKTEKRIIGILPLVENMPDGAAYKPGDVIKMMSGTTVEIISTDAEGRLILADCLEYAKSFKPSSIIDIATLTGAAVSAFGDSVAPIMGNDADMIKNIIGNGNSVKERFWELPLWDDVYKKAIESKISDVKNASKTAGAITAGMFLKEFVDKDVPWVHIDIAGTACDESKMATAFGLRTLIEFIMS